MPSNIMPTLTALNARRIVRTNYFKSFVRMADKILKGGAFAGDPHAFIYSPPRNQSSQAEFLKKAALMSINKYPGDVEKLRVMPPFGPYRSSAFIQRVIVGNQERLKLSATDGLTEFKPAMVKETIERVLAGEVMWEHMVGGKATRVAITTEKFILSPQDMFDRYCQFYDEVRREADKKSEKVDLAAPHTLPQPGDPIYENSDLFGVRHMLAFAYNIKKLADQEGVSWADALSKQTVFILANEKILPEILELFNSFAFFGLDRDKVFFMATANYDALVLTENGKLINQSTPDFIHNHGAARLETTEDQKWFTINEKGKRAPHPASKIEKIYNEHANLQSLNIEDLGYLTNAIDPHTLTLALNGPEIVGGDQQYHMMMDVVGQKKPPQRPQKGGVLAFDNNFFEPGKGRLVMVEAFQTYPRFFHYIQSVAERKYGNIAWLNLNMNNYPNPSVLYQMIKNEGLPVWLDLKPGGFRNESPQGDANYFLPTLFVARTIRKGGKDRPLAIKNLKEASDIPNGLQSLADQAKLPGFNKLVTDLAYKGMIYTGFSFTQLSKLSTTPIYIEAVLVNPEVNELFREKHIRTLVHLKDVFRVKGSMVYSARVEGNEVLIKALDESRKGTAVDYGSKAASQEIKASPVTTKTFKEGRVWVDNKKDYSYIAVANPEKEEILYMFGKYDESVTADKKMIMLADKFERVLLKLSDSFDGTIPDTIMEKISSEFKKISWQSLYEDDVHQIAQQIRAGIMEPAKPADE